MAYLASFETGRQRLVQCLARVTHVSNPDPERIAWSRAFHSLVELMLPQFEGSIAARIEIAPNRSVETTLLATVSTERAGELRNSLARLTRLEVLRPGSIEVCSSRERHDTIAAACLPLQCQIAVPRLNSPNGAWIACDFRVHSFLDDLFAEADAVGCQIQYQVHLATGRLTAEEIRSARRNLLALENLSAVPERLLAHQQELILAFGRSEIVSEEYLSTDTDASAAWLSRKLEQRFGQQFQEIGLPPSTFDFIAGG